MIITLQIETLKRLLESYREDEHINLMLGEGVDVFRDCLNSGPSFEAAKRLLAKMLGSNLSDEEKLKLLLGFAIEDIDHVLSEISRPDEEDEDAAEG